jgi:hypothetical protein
MGGVKLVVIYNHKYLNNISKVEELYKDRFLNICHLMPFYQGTKSNVYTVYENSHRFNGFIAQAVDKIQDISVDHYLFIADDLLLHPAINQTNYKEFFNVNVNSNFISELISFHNLTSFWHRSVDALNFKPKTSSADISKEMPSFEEAKERLQYHGCSVLPLTIKQLENRNQISELPIILRTFKTVKYLVKKLFFSQKKYELAYPLVGGYSDIFILNQTSLKPFAHYSGVFAASNLFVEVAIPTTMALISENLSLETATKLKGLTLWSDKDITSLKNKYISLDNLINNFPDHLYIHPIKLSMWTT